MLDYGANAIQIMTVVSLLMARMTVALSVIPMFVGNTVPTMVRTILVGSLAVALLPLALQDQSVTHISMTTMPLYAAKEAAIGMILGLLASIGFWAVHAAGAIIEFQAGLSMATTIDPLTERDESLVSTLFMQVFTILFLITGGFLGLIGMLFESYRIWPLSSMTPLVGNAKLIQVSTEMLGEMLVLAVKISAPFVILMLVVELAFGYLARFAPQLNVFFLSLPLKVLIMAAMLVVYTIGMSESIRFFPISNFDRLLVPLRGALQ